MSRKLDKWFEYEDVKREPRKKKDCETFWRKFKKKENWNYCEYKEEDWDEVCTNWDNFLIEFNQKCNGSIFHGSKWNFFFFSCGSESDMFLF